VWGSRSASWVWGGRRRVTLFHQAVRRTVETSFHYPNPLFSSSCVGSIPFSSVPLDLPEILSNDPYFPDPRSRPSPRGHLSRLLSRILVRARRELKVFLRLTVAWLLSCAFVALTGPGEHVD